MVILGLTGSIGMGKTTVSRYFRSLGLPVYDADAEVHKLMAKGGRAVKAIEETFPDVARKGTINRVALGKQVFGDAEALRRLESILHPLVWQAERRFLGNAARHGVPVVVLDVPLLLEAEADKLCDAVVVVTAPPFVQKPRVMSRPGMTEERFQAIMEEQMPDAEKRMRADFIINTGRGKSDGLRQAKSIVKVTSSWRGHHWPPNASARKFYQESRN
ncbi:MAG: dephospho-CoA kinase [Rhodospirillaceae bacterium]|jgi:dephospho-CoA kinase|nr:dephospho-CoA kinase [Rhodospirillaceae bacterium]MBT4219891.1 dephospho-CoA kinase [Rhodospirillaceae bacterium]MBT5013687.1 dephospho-CoA kinase [Rhodospirillaceae bacterium]MBT5308469.1 dephospho-CoA kinase [Rhodospirillaceae bacterium]MBT6406669.1 dephospho-CoA kinase [Rhodospirillaceae bacterium]